MIHFSAAICTYNGEKRLPEVLDKLRSQINSESIHWEVIVVDNNSTDNTAKVIRDYQAQWPSAYPLRYFLETQQGAAFARQRAIAEARGEFIGFLDDDNIPAPDWIVEAYSFGKEHPQAGAYGGQIHGDFEVTIPEEYKKVVTYCLAIVERGSKAFMYTPRKGALPPSAGLVVRTQAWRENVPKQPFLAGRVGKSQMASEDLEVLSYIQNAGWEIWYNPNMHIDHKIPQRRLERDYLVALSRGNGLARYYIATLRRKQWQRPLIFPIYMALVLRQLGSHFIRYKGLKRSNIIADCEMEFILSSLLSPFFMGKVYLSSLPKKVRQFNNNENRIPARPISLPVGDVHLESDYRSDRSRP